MVIILILNVKENIISNKCYVNINYEWIWKRIIIKFYNIFIIKNIKILRY